MLKSSIGLLKVSSLGMKKEHVFIVHSNLSLIVASQVIADRGLDEQGCLFLIDTSRVIARFSSDVDSINFDYHTSSRFLRTITPRLSLWDFVQVRIEFCKVHLELRRLLKCRFTLYTPNGSMPMSQILSSSSLCKRIFSLEEGTSTLGFYLPEVRPTFHAWNPFQITKGGIIPYEYYKFEGIIYLNKIRGLLPGSSVSFMQDLKRTFKDHSVLWIFDSLVETGRFSFDEYIERFRYIGTQLRNEGVVQYAQFHPSQSERVKDAVLMVCPDIIVVNECLETLVSCDVKIKIFGFSSSLLYYLSLSDFTSTSCLAPSEFPEYMAGIFINSAVRLQSLY